MKAITSVKLSIAIFGVSFFWGTTYLAIRIAVQTVPPVYVVGLRHFMAGIILLVYLMISKKFVLPSWSRLLGNIILASLMLILANGLTTYGEKTIPSGLTALLTTLSPLMVMTINISSGKEKFSLKVVLGVFLGLLGMILLFYNSLNQLTEPAYRTGIICILIAIACWSIGTVYSKSIKRENNHIFVDLCIQMLFAGTTVLLGGFIFQIPFEVQTWELNHILAIFYLTLFGSIAGFVSYLYALSKLPSTTVSVFTYFNVVVALFLGWLILDEHISDRLIISTALILTGVVIANYKKKTARPAVQGMLIEE
jgi:drug/metabolite transporter (DMT)-like permease